MDLCFFGCLRDALWLLRVALVELVPRLLSYSVKSMKIPAAQCPEIRNPFVAHHSTQPLHFCHHPSSFLCRVDLQPACAQMNTFPRICIPILFCRMDIREDANNHKVICCKNLSGNLCTVVEQTSQMDSDL